MVYFSSLKLTGFRNYSSARIESLESGLVAFHGANGAGKTNILEALSLFSPGRGLRGSKVLEMQNNASSAGWGVAANLQTDYGAIQLGTGLEANSDKRVIRINGENVKGQSVLTKNLSVLWLTPQMDRLFLDSSRERRRFLDRMVFAFDTGHSGRITRYDNALSQRSKLLKDGRDDPAWLDGLEAQMAETGVSIAAARLDFVERLQNVSHSKRVEGFPLGILRAQGTLEELLISVPAIEVEDLFQYQLAQSRGVDRLTGGAATGPHKSDLKVVYADKNMPADQCSTGEQKALLIGLILANARLVRAEKGDPPILLFDEVSAHLDEKRRALLYQQLYDLRGQAWLTGTDEALFQCDDIAMQVYEIAQGSVLT